MKKKKLYNLLRKNPLIHRLLVRLLIKLNQWTLNIEQVPFIKLLIYTLIIYVWCRLSYYYYQISLILPGRGRGPGGYWEAHFTFLWKIIPLCSIFYSKLHQNNTPSNFGTCHKYYSQMPHSCILSMGFSPPPPHLVWLVFLKDTERGTGANWEPTHLSWAPSPSNRWLRG